MSKPIETRPEFQKLAEIRLEEAKGLLDLGKWDGAYYLTGYAVELALKACIIKTWMTSDKFPPKDFSKDCYTHRLEPLISVSRLTDSLQIANDADPNLKRNWQTVKDWSEEKRYHRMDQGEAEAIYIAVADANHGVLQWLKSHW